MAKWAKPAGAIRLTRYLGWAGLRFSAQYSKLVRTIKTRLKNGLGRVGADISVGFIIFIFYFLT
jgi:hypothetical protein